MRRSSAPWFTRAAATRRARLGVLRLAVLAIVMVSGCANRPGEIRWRVGGTVTGLAGTGLVLHSSLGEDLPVTGNGSFAFAVLVPTGTSYTVTVGQLPAAPTQFCSIANGVGTMGSADVTDVRVVCSSLAFKVGGTVTGLTGTGLKLRNNGGDELSVAAAGAFTFATPVASGATYEVTIQAQPSNPTQLCKVTDGTGTGVVGNADVTGVTVTCETQAFKLGGTVTGLTGTGLKLHNNGGDELSVAAAGAFTFATPIASGAAYEVKVQAQPSSPTQFCSIASGVGTMGGADVTDVRVVCSALAFKVGGTITGLRGTGLMLRNNGGDDLSVAANGAFTFATPVASGATYDVRLQAYPSSSAQPVQLCRVTSGTGSVGNADVTSVSVTCRAWGTAQLIETDNAGNATSSQVAIDSGGNAIAVWCQFDGTRYNIWANRYAAGSSWGTAQLIETDNAGRAASPQVAIDLSGNALAVWQQSDGTRYNIWANRYTAGSGWGTAQLIETDNAGNALNPQVAIDSGGNAIAVWFQIDGTRSNIWANRYTATSGWGAAQLIETDNAGDAAYPQVAIDLSGNAIAVWQQSGGTRYNIWANRYTAGSGWGSAQLIETDNAGDAIDPRVAIDSAGNALAVWQQFDGMRMNIWSNRYTASSGWGAAQLIETDNAGDAPNPQVAFDSAGNAIVVWCQSDGTRYNIWANRYAIGSGWGTAQLIETDNAGDALNPQVAFDSSGNAIAVWYQSDGTRYNIWANRFE